MEAAQNISQMHGWQEMSASWLEKHPLMVRGLKKYAKALEDTLQWTEGRVLSLKREHIEKSQNLRESHGLTVRDSIIVQFMLDLGLRAIASSRNAFGMLQETEDLKHIVFFKPTDLPSDVS